jgi:Lrp/AsnC family transcriptional regulator, leucine-responsive regulatory protein
MDAIDQKILRHLMVDAHLTNSKLAKLIGMSESATLERVRRLESAGVIEGYTIKVAPSRVGRGLELFMTITLKDLGHMKEFEEAISSMDEVLTCAQTLGRCDFLVHVAVKDVAELSNFVNDKLIPLGNIDRVESLTVLNMLKRYHPPIPLE